MQICPRAAQRRETMSAGMLPQLNKATALEVLIAVVANLLVAAIACRLMFWYGAPNGHNIYYNLVWLHNFSAQLAQGDFYPRWLMDMNHGAGSPVFYFYAPLPFYIASIPVVALSGYKLSIQLAWGEWLLLALSGIAFFRYARRRFEMRTALLCSSLYMLLPYHFEIDLWRRQDLGELANYIWMPLVLYYTDQLLASRRAIAGLAVSYALVIVSHLPSALLFSICLGGYMLVSLSDRHSLFYVLRFSGGVVIGLLLAGLYLVPALFSQQYVRAEVFWGGYYDFHLWFFPIKESDLWRNDPETLVFAPRLFTVVCITTAMFASCWLSAFRWGEAMRDRKLVGCLMLIGFAWFLMSPWSTFVWENAPELWRVQFPWRVSMVVDLAATIAALHAVDAAYHRRDWFSAAAIVTSMALLTWCLATANFRSTLNPFYDPNSVAVMNDDLQNGIDASEYTTAWNPSRSEDSSIQIAGLNRLIYDSGSGSIITAHWWPRDIELKVQLWRSAQVSVRQFYYPNWSAKTAAGDPLRVTPSKQNGLILINLPAGAYSVRLKLEPLRQEVFGAEASALGVILLVVGSLWNIWSLYFRRPTAAGPGRVGATLSQYEV